jgi:hypothetical protein
MITEHTTVSFSDNLPPGGLPPGTVTHTKAGLWRGVPGSPAADAPGIVIMTTSGSTSQLPWLKIEGLDTSYTTRLEHSPATMLEITAANADENGFIEAASTIDWSSRGVGGFRRAVRLAIRAGAYLFARNMANQGAELHPEDAELQKMARILAPPRVVDADIPRSRSVRANHDWLRENASEYEGQWIALRHGTLLASGRSAREVWDRLHTTEDVMLTKVL